MDDFFRNARARNTHVEANLNHSFPAQALAGYSMAESSPILADAVDAKLAWSATATRVPELPESCVLVLELADATVFTFGFPRPPPPPRPRDAAERHFAEALLVGEAELLGIARLFGLLGATTLACACLRGACARVANCVHRDRRKARAADLGLESRETS